MRIPHRSVELAEEVVRYLKLGFENPGGIAFAGLFPLPFPRTSTGPAWPADSTV